MDSPYRRETRWFCNKPLSPVQAPHVSSSDESMNTTDHSPQKDSVLNGTNTEPQDDFSEKDISDINADNVPEISEAEADSDENEISCISGYSDDSIEDPTFVISNEDEEETSSDGSNKDLSDVEELDDGNSQTSVTSTSNFSADKPSSSVGIEQSKTKMNQVPTLVSVATSDVPGKIKSNGEKRKGNKSKDYCFFCEDHVLNFARHIIRQHSYEYEVKRIASLQPNTKERKLLLTQLRKKGNFIYSSFYSKPVKQRATEGNILPCSNCMGFYSSKLLWHHRRKCMNNVNKGHKAEAQNMLLRNLKIDPELTQRVFPRMQADEISLVAKQDSLICAYGARYIKIHREQHFELVASRKMRELARLLIELRKLEPTKIKSLFSALNPKYFSLLVEATKIVSKYDSEKQMYGSGTYALNIATSLKQCCDIAILYALQRKSVYANISTAKAQARLRSLSDMLKEHWRFEVSHKAASDVSMKKWNKVTIVPLASDLKLLKEHLINEASEAVKRLENDSADIKAYKILLETVFCRVMLLNRRRPGELQRLELHTYQECGKIQNYEEFSEAVSPLETMLMKSLKRVIIRGKRGRGVPVLFSHDVQNHIDILIKFRRNFIKNNIYLFANVHADTPLCGYKTLQKYAVSCGAKNPGAISSTKLRKHLATLSQLFNMSENDIEQLASFMGHTLGVHRGSYRLPTDVFQMAKISKVLLLMEKGEAGIYKGKTLDDINIDLEENLIEEEDKESAQDVTPLEKLAESKPENSGKMPKNKIVRTPWTTEQKDVVKEYFQEHIKKKKPPKKNECLSCKEKHSTILGNKDWLKIKVFVQNCYSKKFKN